MKKVLAILLVVAMMAGVLPALTFTALAASSKVQYGLTADFYQIEEEAGHFGVQYYAPIVGNTDGRGARVDYGDSKHFDQSIKTIMDTSVVMSEYGAENVTAFDDLLDQDGYLIKWEGTVTASADGTYYLIGRKIDNGFAMFVEQDGEMKKVYEYWATNHWFDGPDDRLPTDLGGFTLKAGVPTNIEAYYLEGDGGQALSFDVSTNSDFSNAVSMGSALTFDMTRTLYASKFVNNHDVLQALIPWGNGNGEGDKNGKDAADAANHRFGESFDKVKAAMTKLGSCVVPNYETESQAYGHQFGYFDDDCMIEYTGYVTPTIGGTYTFGTSKVDNCLMVELTDEDTDTTTRVYEFWGSGIYNDRSDTFSDTTVTLEQGKTYKIHAVFLEIDGGQAIESKIKIDDNEYTMTTAGLTFTVEKPQGEVMPTTVPFLADASKVEWHYMTSGTNNTEQIRDNAWMKKSEVYGKWATHTGRFTSDDNSWPTEKGVSNMESGKNHQSLWAVAEFNVEDPAAFEGYTLAAHMEYDDNIRVYINGYLLFTDTGWTTGTQTKKLATDAKGLFVTGTNTFAVKLVQGFGGASFTSDLYATKNDEGGTAQTFYNIGNKEELLAFVAEANRRGNDTKNMTVNLTADIDMTGEEWTPVNKWVGKFYGNGHTISGLEYTAKVDATKQGDGLPVGLMFTSIANDNANGRVFDLNLENCTLTVNATEGNGKEQQVIAGILVGMVDRGIVENVTVKGCTINGNPGIAGGVAGVVCWGADEKGVHLENCASLGNTITATNLAAGIVAYLRGNDTEFTIGNMEVNGVNFVTEGQYKEGIGAKWGWGEKDPHITSEEYENNTSKVTIGLDDGKDYAFYSQTRAGTEEGKTDFRVVAVVKLEWLRAVAKANVKISFTKDGDTKSTDELSLKTVYQALNAKDDSVQVTYVAEEGVVLLGWTVTNVPADYAANGVTANMITE